MTTIVRITTLSLVKSFLKNKIMIEFNKVEQDLLEVILQKAINNSDYKNYGPVIKNIYYKLGL